MQYIKFRGTLRPAAKHAANDAEKLIAIIFPSSLPKHDKINFYQFKNIYCYINLYCKKTIIHK